MVILVFPPTIYYMQKFLKWTPELFLFMDSCLPIYLCGRCKLVSPTPQVMNIIIFPLSDEIYHS